LLTDICEQALAVARINVQQHQCHQRVGLLQSDLFGGLTDQQFDLIVSNPPYVDAIDFADMPDEYHHEPRLGLVSGDDGLDFTRQLLAQAETYLRPGGALIVEVGNSAPALEQAFPRMPFTWLEFSAGDSGVFFVTREELFKSCQPAS
jgi:ribosomal protein L3 glutamine methyltransferase